MTIEAAALAMRISEQGADEVEQKLDKIDRKSKAMGDKTTVLKFTAPSIERVDNQLTQLGKQVTLYQEGAKYASTKAGSTRELVDAERQLQGIVSSSATTLEQRIVAERQLAQIAAATPTGISKVTGAFGQLGAVLGTLGVVMSAGAVVGFFAHITSQAIEAGDALHDLSMRTGISVENLSVLGQVGAKSGATTEMLSIGFRKLSKEIINAQEGSKESIATFAKLGISVDDLRGKSLHEIFLMIADAQEKFNDGAGKNDVMMKLLGRSGEALIPTMHELANGGFDRARERAEKLGSVMSKEFSDKADAFNDHVVDLHSALKGLGMVIADPLLPWMTRLVLGFTNLAERAQRAGSIVGNVLMRVGPLAPILGLANRILPQSFFGIEGGSSTTAPVKKKDIPTDPVDAEKARVKAIDDEIEALSSLASFHKLTSKDMMDAIALEQKLTTEYDKGTTSRQRRAAILKELKDLESIVLKPIKLSDVADIQDTAHDPKLVGVNKEGKMTSPFAGMRGTRGQSVFDRALTKGDTMAGSALSGLLDMDSPTAQAALDMAYAKLMQYMGKKEPIPIDVAIQLSDLERATANVDEQFRKLIPNLSQGIFESIGVAIGSGIGQGKDALLGALGGIFISMGRALITYGIAMTGLSKALLNPFSSGPAAIAAGTLLVALGSKLSSLAQGKSGGGGGGGNAAGFSGGAAPSNEERNQFEVVFDPDRKLRKGPAVVPTTRGLSNVPLPDAKPNVYIGNINALDPDNGRWQRAVADTVNNAIDRNLIKKNG